MRKAIVAVFVVGYLSVLGVSAAQAQPSGLEDRVSRLESNVSRVEANVRDQAGTASMFVLFGAFCALWAQNTGRSAWRWFFLGLFFNVVTVLVLLSKNSNDRARATEPPIPEKVP